MNIQKIIKITVLTALIALTGTQSKSANEKTRREERRAEFIAAISYQNFPLIEYLLETATKKEAHSLANEIAKNIAPYDENLAPVMEPNNEPVLTATVGSSSRNDTNIAQALLDHGADINGHDKNGETALMRAIMLIDIKMTEFLLKNKADVNAHDIHGDTALMKGVQIPGNTDKVKKLLIPGTDINAHNNNGDTALMLAIKKRDNTDMVEELIKAKADVNAHNNNGDTALMLATLKDKPDIIIILLEAGADIEATNNKGQTALAIAVRINDKELAELLIDKGASIGDLGPQIEAMGIQIGG